MSGSRVLRFLFVLSATFVLAGCGGSNQVVTPAAKTGTVFIIGTDAPLSSVLAFQVNITGLTASDGTNTVTLLSGSQPVEFTRLNGLRTLLDLQTVAVGSFNTITATLASPVISFLDTGTTPPKVSTMNGTLTQSSITVHLRQPLVVTEGELVGLVLDFRLRDSMEVDATGQFTGRVTPKVSFHAIPPDAPEAHIDELRGGVVSVDLLNKKFVMQGPRGRQITVVTDDQTHFESGEGLDQLDTNTIVQVSGSLQRISLTLKASEVLILSKDRFLLGGLITDVRPASGTADEIDLLVRSELPDIANVQAGQIATLSFDGNERFMISRLRMVFTTFLFNRDSLVRGQHITAGGLLDTSLTPPKLDTRRVWLHAQGLEGAWVPGSTNATAGTFMFNTAGITGLLFDEPVKIFASPLTFFVGLGGLGDLTGTNPIRLRVVGIVLLDHSTGKPVIIARFVEKLPIV